MTLQNLLKVGRVKHARTQRRPEAQWLLLAAIRRNLADAEVPNLISDETRFDVAYKAVMQCALVAMMSAGLLAQQPTAPGHHQTMIPVAAAHPGLAPPSLGRAGCAAPAAERKRLHRPAYRSLCPVGECLAQAKTLRKLLRAQLANKHPELMKPA